MEHGGNHDGSCVRLVIEAAARAWQTVLSQAFRSPEFLAFVDVAAPVIHRLANSIVRDRQLAEEVADHVYDEIFKVLATFDFERQRFWEWLEELVCQKAALVRRLETGSYRFGPRSCLELPSGYVLRFRESADPAFWADLLGSLPVEEHYVLMLLGSETCTWASVAGQLYLTREDVQVIVARVCERIARMSAKPGDSALTCALKAFKAREN